MKTPTPEEVLEKNLNNISSTTFRDMQLDDDGLFKAIIKAMRDYAEALYTERIEKVSNELPNEDKWKEWFVKERIVISNNRSFDTFMWMKEQASLVIAKEREKNKEILELKELQILSVKLLEQKDKEIEESNGAWDDLAETSIEQIGILNNKILELNNILDECRLQFEYLNGKFGETGTTNNILSKITTNTKTK